MPGCAARADEPGERAKELGDGELNDEEPGDEGLAAANRDGMPDSQEMAFWFVEAGCGR
jgi:hypothetical protein